MRVINNFLVNPSYGGQLTIVDAQHPGNLIETAWTSLGTSLVWDADPYLPSGIIVATAKNEGLFVFQPTYTRAGYLEGRVTGAQSGQPLGRVKVVVSDSYHSDVTKSDGTFHTGALPGVYSVQVGKIGYQALTVGQVTLKPGASTWLELALEPIK